MTLGTRLMLARESLGLTRSQAAEKAGVLYQYWADIEADRKPISLEKLFEIAQKLEVDPSSLDARLASKIGALQNAELEAKAQELAQSMFKAAIKTAMDAAQAAAYQKFGIEPEKEAE